jgi:hypothetical protein
MKNYISKFIKRGASAPSKSPADAARDIPTEHPLELSKAVILPTSAKALISKMVEDDSLQLLRDHSVRRAVVVDRLANYMRHNERIRIFEGGDVKSIPRTVEWNLDGLKHLAGFGRGDQVLRVLLSIDDIFQRIASLKVLIVGPRIEDELLALVAWGFSADNVHGLDLISYSPFVDLGDMHNLPYPDSTFDVAILSNVITYSTDYERVCSELLRVCNQSSILGVAESYDRRSKDVAQSHFNSMFGEDSPPRNLDSPEDILALFGDSVGDVIFRHPIPEGVELGSNIVIFRRKLVPPGEGT